MLRFSEYAFTRIILYLTCNIQPFEIEWFWNHYFEPNIWKYTGTSYKCKTKIETIKICTFNFWVMIMRWCSKLRLVRSHKPSSKTLPQNSHAKIFRKNIPQNSIPAKIFRKNLPQVSSENLLQKSSPKVSCKTSRKNLLQTLPQKSPATVSRKNVRKTLLQSVTISHPEKVSNNNLSPSISHPAI